MVEEEFLCRVPFVEDMCEFVGVRERLGEELVECVVFLSEGVEKVVVGGGQWGVEVRDVGNGGVGFA